MSLISPPCTILLRINGGFERICDATVIENGDHLHYEKPVGSVIVLEETTHKVLYIMNKEDICPSDLVTDESYWKQANGYCNSEGNLSDVASQQALCTSNKANCTNYKNDFEQQRPKLKIENGALQNKRSNVLIDDSHAINSKNESPNSIQKLALEDESNSLNFKEKVRNQSVFDNKSVYKRANETTDDNGHNGLDYDRVLQFNNFSSYSSEKERTLLSTQFQKCNSKLNKGANQVSNQLSTMLAEVHTNNDNKESSNGEENEQQLKIVNSEQFSKEEKSENDNKTITLNQSEIENNERALKVPSINSHDISLTFNEEHQINEHIEGEVNSRLDEKTSIPVDSKDTTKSSKIKMPPTISMASLTSSLDYGSNWTRPLRRRSTMSTIISTTSCSTNTANTSTNLKKFQSGSNQSSSLFRNCHLSSKKSNPANSNESEEGCIDKLRPDKVRSNEMEIKEGHQDKIQFRAHKGAPSELDIEEKILQRREMAHLFKWYYPEGGWGWVVLCAAMFSQAICHGGLQLGFSYPLGVIIRKSFGAIQQQSRREEMLFSIDNEGSMLNELIEASSLDTTLLSNVTSRIEKGMGNSSEDHLSQLQIGKKNLIFHSSFPLRQFATILKVLNKIIEN